MKKKPPKILTDAGLSMFVNTRALAELPLPVESVEIEKLIWHFDMPVWEKDGTDDWNLTPWEVIHKAPGSSGHQERVEKSDLNFPAVIATYNGRYVLLDGVHRLVKAYLRGQPTIPAKIIPKKYLSRLEYQT